jgi:hypothetical protein
VATGDTDEHFHGIVRGVRPTGPKHIDVTIELSHSESERLLASKRRPWVERLTY